MFGTSISTTIQRGDSNESEESVGDMPIELRYLESDFFMDSFVIPETMSLNSYATKEKDYQKPIPQIASPTNGIVDKPNNKKDAQLPPPIPMTKSKSLDDLINTIIAEKANKRKRKIGIGEFKPDSSNRIPMLSETGRSSTYEEQTTSSKDVEVDFMSLQAQHYYNQQLFLLLRHRHRHFSTNSQQSSRPTSTSLGSSKITRTPGSTFDYDDLMMEEHSSSRPQTGENEDNEDSGKGVSGNKNSGSIMKGLRTFSASMKSIDISIRSTSISSISSGKSLFSNFSVKSDSGIGHGGGKTTSQNRSRHKSTSPSSSKIKASTENVTVSMANEMTSVDLHMKKDPIILGSSKDTKCRNWESEPHLDKIDPSQQKMSILLKLKRGGSADETSVMSSDVLLNPQKHSSPGALQQSESHAGSSRYEL